LFLLEKFLGISNIYFYMAFLLNYYVDIFRFPRNLGTILKRDKTVFVSRRYVQFILLVNVDKVVSILKIRKKINTSKKRIVYGTNSTG